VKYNPDKHKRRSIRLKGHDYSAAGTYFITLCTHQRDCLFGEIADGVMQLNTLGEIVQTHWMRLPKHHPNLQLDAFVVMPNHFHGILVLTQNHLPHTSHTSTVGAGLADPSTVSANPVPTKPALPYSADPVTTKPTLPYSDTLAIATNPVLTKPTFPYSTDSETTQPIQTYRSQHLGGGGAGSIDTFIDGSHDVLAKPAPTETFTHNGIPEMIRGFKTFSARRINEKRRMQGCPVWQRNYYEHIVRNNQALQTIQAYIHNNPQSWTTDQLHNTLSKW
jgi:putative transposase